MPASVFGGVARALNGRLRVRNGSAAEGDLFLPDVQLWIFRQPVGEDVGVNARAHRFPDLLDEFPRLLVDGVRDLDGAVGVRRGEEERCRVRDGRGLERTSEPADVDEI